MKDFTLLLYGILVLSLVMLVLWLLDGYQNHVQRQFTAIDRQLDELSDRIRFNK